MAARGVRFLATDIRDTPDNGKKYEVIDGDLYVSPAPVWKHQRQLNRLNVRVSVWVENHRLGDVVTAPTTVMLDDENGLEPDLLFVSNERAHIIADDGVEGAPDLVVEVLSPSTQSRDRGLKLRRYAASGVPHYWILDTEGSTHRRASAPRGRLPIGRYVRPRRGLPPNDLPRLGDPAGRDRRLTFPDR